ncbi:MAG: sulfatase [Proteobacteria bacterium]|nr:sulfatase [Pseudomonadota bacterium]
MRQNGPVIDLGTSDQHKYTRGGWKSGWTDPLRVHGVTAAKIDGTSADLTVVADAPIVEVVVRARAPQSTRMSLAIDGKTLGHGRVGDNWTVIRVGTVRPVPAGRRMISLATRTVGAIVDWVWVRTGRSRTVPDPGPRMQPMRLGKQLRRALKSPPSRSYSFYLHVPRKAALTFDYGADSAAEFEVAARTSSTDRVSLFRKRATPNRWIRARVDLSAFAGRAIRLDLVTSGSAEKAGWGEPELVVPTTRPPLPSPRQRAKNAIMIVMDTTRADAFSAFAPDRAAITPNLDAFSAGAVVFENAYNNENWTIPSTATILSGLYPHTHGAQRAGQSVADEVTLLSEHLRSNGFRTKAIVANAVVSEAFGFKQGWDEWNNTARAGITGAEKVFGEAAAWLTKHGNDGRFFLYIHSMDAHTPYSPDQEYVKRYYSGDYRGWVGDAFDKVEQRAVRKGWRRTSQDDHAWIRALYYGEITYQDEHMGRLLAHVQEMGLLDDTLVIVTNDHGEELYDHQSTGHGYTLYEELLRAPLVVAYSPLFPAGMRVPEVVEHVDLAPTVTDALGVRPLPDADGLSLLSAIHGVGVQRPYSAVADHRDEKRVIRIGRWKLTLDDDGSWLSLYDLVDDPGEQHDRKADRLLAGRLCEIYLGEALSSPRKSTRLSASAARLTFTPGQSELDPKTRRELEALGYIEGQ